MKIKVKDLSGCENVKDYYYVDSEDGKIHGSNGEPLATHWVGNPKYPYQGVDLTLKGSRDKVTKRNARIIALALVPGRTEEKNEVDHINGIRDDDRPVNLRWVSHKQNCKLHRERIKMQNAEPKKMNLTFSAPMHEYIKSMSKWKDMNCSELVAEAVAAHMAENEMQYNALLRFRTNIEDI